MIPNLKLYEEQVLKSAVEGENAETREEAEKIVRAITAVLASLVDDRGAESRPNGHVDDGEQTKARLTGLVGELVASRIVASDQMSLAHALLEHDTTMSNGA